MNTIKINLYKFSELSDEAKEKAITQMWDVNVSHDWWDGTYEDAERISMKIEGFDLDRGSYCKAKFLAGGEETAHKIEAEHGEDCETYKTAAAYLKERDAAVENAPKDEDGDTDEYELDKILDELEAEFLKSLCEDYRIILDKEYDYLTSKEQIIESIEANEYEFSVRGKFGCYSMADAE